MRTPNRYRDLERGTQRRTILLKSRKRFELAKSEALVARTQRGGGVVPRQAHNLEIVGANPTPAT